MRQPNDRGGDFRFMTEGIEIAGRTVGPGRPCLIIAEAGVNHNGDRDLALRLVDAAADAGADAIKFQTFKAGRLVTRRDVRGESQYQMLRPLELNESVHREIAERCRRREILFLSTPFDEERADFLDELGVPAFKIASGELTHFPLLTHVSRKGKPILLSTGMGTVDEIQNAVDCVRAAGNSHFVLLHCVSNYPTNPADANLRAIPSIASHFNCPVGYSDHTEGIEIPLAAAALGACVIEKHFTLDRSLPGPDQFFSLDPKDFQAMVRGVRTVELALGHGRKEPMPGEKETAKAARRSAVAARDIRAGEKITKDMLTAKRPGTGVPPSRFDEIRGRTAAVDISADTLISWEMLK